MKFSVLLPTRNRLELLTRAIETVRRQDYENWEIIISDNFSDADICSHIQSYNDTRIKYYRTSNFIPVTENWNNALDKSDGDYVIMLGDDDCLMKDYFSTLKRYIELYESPDFIFTNAFLYAYPGAMPNFENGFLKIYSNKEIYQAEIEPFWLKKEKALIFVKDSMDFRVTFDYNMQFSLVSRVFIDKLRRYGPFYQSPYPDYYASNAMMLKAERILVVPIPLVTIGISKKSFGFYYFNDLESDGNKFLNNLADQKIVQRLDKIILPGSPMNTSWLISMETLAVNIAHEFGIKVNYSRYRLVQIFSIYISLIMGKKSVRTGHEQLKNNINFLEWLRFGIFLSVTSKITPQRYKHYIIRRLRTLSASHPSRPMPTLGDGYDTILDVFEQIDPKNYVKYIQQEPLNNG